MINDEFRKVVLTQMRETLKPAGFKKKGNNFFKQENDVYLIIQLQSSMFSSQYDLRVTINLGVFSTLLQDASGALNNPSLIKSHWRQRIGFLTEEKLDKWWTVTSFNEAQKTGLEISKLLTERVLPVLFSLDSTAKLISLWEKGESAGITDFQRNNFLEKLKS